MKARRSLKSRALQWLAQRDQSRLELKRKLLRRAQRDAAEAAAGKATSEDAAPQDALADATDATDASDASDASDATAEVEALLDWLEAQGFLSDERFVESRVHAREARFGNLRIRSELGQHGLAASPPLLQALVESELARAATVRERRFPELPRSAAERAAQCRFLAARGFSPEAIHRLMRQLRVPAGGAAAAAGEGP
jgi:regulatory protein